MVSDALTSQTLALPRGLSFRTRLFLLVTACLVPLIAFMLGRQYLSYQEAVEATSARMLGQARRMAGGIEQELQRHVTALQVLAQSRPLRDGDLDDFRIQAEAVIAQQFPGTNILLLREDGQQLMNTIVPRGAALPVRPNLASTRRVFATGQPSVSDLYLGAVGARPLVGIDVPVTRGDGTVAYVLSIIPSLESFAEIIRRQHALEPWSIAVFDRQGVYLARTPGLEPVAGQKAPPDLLGRLLAEREGVLTEGATHDGVARLAAFSRTNATGWAVAISLPRAELTAPAALSAMRTLAVGGVLLAIALALAVVLARQITGPMAVLRRLAVATDKSIRLDAPRTGLPEADDVIEALRMGQENRKRHDTETLERTRQLWAANAALQNEVSTRRQAEQTAQAQLGRLNLLHHITRAIAERQDLNSIFQVVVRTLEDQLPVDFTCLCLYDPTDRVLTVVRVGLNSGALATELAMTERARVDIDENGVSRCVRGQLVYEPDIENVAFPFPQRLAKAGLRSLVVAPLQVESQVFGVLVVARTQRQGFVSGECEFLRQLSEHVALAAHQAQLYGALQQAYDDLRQTQQAVMQQERLRALGQMASGIAHDINNALSPVALYTETLLETEAGLSPRARDYLETIQRAVEDVGHTVGRMRDFYRQREPQITLGPVYVNPLVQQVVDLTRARWSDMPLERGIVTDVQTELAPDLPAIMGVESEIREALINLILNAVDAVPNGGEIVVRTGAIHTEFERGQVQIEIADDGIGMDEETRRRCLEPFFTTKGERGTGLGLAMVYGAMRRHSAEMEIDSAPGKGTVIRLSFAIPAKVADGRARTGSPYVVPSRLRLLVIDDDPLLLKSLRDILESDGHVVTTAGEGQSGIDAFRAAHEQGETFAIVITDLGMPYVDGRKVAAAVKDISPSTPVILLTGWGQQLIADDDIPPHVDHVLSKPPKLRDIRAGLALVYCRQAEVN